MTIWLVIHEDRHIDVQVAAYAMRDKAIAEAKRIATIGATHGGRYPESKYTKDDFDGAEWFATYGGEGDSVRVMEVELQQ